MDWYEHYKARVNSKYQEYFEYKYGPFLLYIRSQMREFNSIIDAGGGIGSVSKHLRHHYQGDLVYLDKSDKMRELARENVSWGIRDFYIFDITDHKIAGPKNTLCVTHGVLEHFEDDVIKSILERFPNSIHYVPLEKYGTPSFGDERLLPSDYWREKFNISYGFEFNDGYDFCFQA